MGLYAFQCNARKRGAQGVASPVRCVVYAKGIEHAWTLFSEQWEFMSYSGGEAYRCGTPLTMAEAARLITSEGHKTIGG